MEPGDLRTLFCACVILFSFGLYQMSGKPFVLGLAVFTFVLWLDLRLK